MARRRRIMNALMKTGYPLETLQDHRLAAGTEPGQFVATGWKIKLWGMS